MENAILITLSRQITLQRKMDVMANNMANMNTAGFKNDELKFEEYLAPVASDEGFKAGDKRVKFVIDPHMVRDLSAGTHRQTGRELDVALSGKGWMVVNSPNGERFTRNGQLNLSGDGTLVTSDGYPVLGEGGPITFEQGETGIIIAKDGTISTSQGDKDKLRIVEFANPQAMRKQGSSLYSSEEAPGAAQTTTVIQGSFENSNVQPMKQMTQMIETVRAYTDISRMLKVADDTRGKAIQQLGRMEN